MTKEIEYLEVLRIRNIKDANRFHTSGDTRMEEICIARADAYQNAIDVVSGKVDLNIL